MTIDTAAQAPVAWHTLDGADATVRLSSDPDHGLGLEEVTKRQAEHGPNAIRAGKRRGALGMLVSQFTDFMILLLLAAAVISGIAGDAEDTVVILAIVVLNAIVGFVQEYRADKAMAALQRMGAPNAMVIRAGTHQPVPAKDLVPGDIVVLEAGNAIPADLRLIEAIDLRLGEAALTGESLPVDKQTASIPDPGLPIADRRDMAFSGTVVLYGRGRGLVVGTGMNTELGRIAGMLDAATGARTPLQQRLTRFGRQMAIAAIAICVLIFAFGLLRGEPPILMLLTAISLAVAAIPEAMPAVVTVVLALGAARMARAHALIRRLPAVETPGSVTVICSDKTGTLTRNEMQAVEAFVAGKRLPVPGLDIAKAPVPSLMRAMALCNDVTAGADGMPIGDPTETALWQAGRDSGIPSVDAVPMTMEVPFDSERKRMTTVHPDGAGFVAYTKGAPETVLAQCVSVATADGPVPIDQTGINEAANAMAADGLRVLAVAYRPWTEAPPAHDAAAVERDLILLGLIGLLDPPRAEAKTAVATCQAAGIKPVMITGDHPVTARAIARQLGITDEKGAVITGRDLQTLSDGDLLERVADTTVYARVDPSQKIRIVEALRQSGEIVAMTGDGVNDAPALASADIGVAMGKGGTDVAREAASLVLLDDNFATIVTAVCEGRRIYDNIRKFIRFVVTCNSAEILTIFLPPFLGLPVPLLPIQILWINLVTDGLPGLALAAEPAERDIMRRPPRPPTEGLFAGGMLSHIIWVGCLMAGLTLGTQAFCVWTGRENWQTMVFTVLTFAQMWHVVAIRSERASLFQQGLLSNKPLLCAVGLTFGLQLAVIYVPALNQILDTAPLSLIELLGCIGVSGLIFVGVEIEKWVRRTRHPIGGQASRF